MARDDFPEPVRRKCAERVNYLCSNPSCRVFTSMPHSEPEKSVRIGVAAHICAASPGGPRFNPGQPSHERCGIPNAIWLCASCAAMIDRDTDTYSVATLEKWRAEAELFAGGKRPLASLPKIEIITLDGLCTDAFPNPTQHDIQTSRDHVLTILNSSQMEMLDLRIYIQVPEHMVDNTIAFKTDQFRIDLVTQDLRKRAVTTVTEIEGTVEQMPLSQNAHRGQSFLVHKLEPSRHVRVVFRTTISSTDPVSDIEVSQNNIGIENYFYVQGVYRYKWKDSFFEGRFFSRLFYDPSSRSLKAMSPTENPIGRTCLIMTMPVGLQAHLEKGGKFKYNIYPNL